MARAMTEVLGDIERFDPGPDEEWRRLRGSTIPRAPGTCAGVSVTMRSRQGVHRSAHARLDDGARTRGRRHGSRKPPTRPGAA